MERYQNLGLVVGETLKRLIKESEYVTQENFADAFGADVRTVRRWIQHGTDSLTTILRIANILNVDVWAILPV